MPLEIEKVGFATLSNFFPKQKLALEATKTYKYVLFGGTKGSGKSRFLRFAAVWWLYYLFKKYKLEGLRAGIFCEDYPALEDRHISKIRVEFPDWLGDFKEQKHEFHLKPWYGGGVIAFRNLDDVAKYESAEFAWIGIDELQKNALPVFNTLRQRLRWPGISTEDLKFVGAGIPGGEPWVTQYWIDRIFPPEEKEQHKFFFIQALPHDNPNLDPEYYNSLNSLPASERRAYMEGDWHAFDRDMDKGGWTKLLTPVELQNAFTETLAHAGVSILGVDPGAGGDESAIVYRSSTVSQICYSDKLSDTMALIPIITKLAQETAADIIAIDVVGLGKPIYDRLKELRVKNVVGVNFGSSPQSKKADTREFLQKTHANLKAELYDRLRDWILRKGGKLLYDTGWNELSIVKYKIDSDRQMKIQGKEELLRSGLKSPNNADALALTFIENEETIVIRKEAEAQAWQDELYPQKEDFGFVK